jgi:hypothetical protein
MFRPLVGSSCPYEAEGRQEVEHLVKRSVTVQTEHYRGYQIETRDPRGRGWSSRSSPPTAGSPGDGAEYLRRDVRSGGGYAVDGGGEAAGAVGA